jgi:subtilase family serine protease
MLTALAVLGGVAATLPATAAAAGSATVPSSHPSWASPSAKVANTAAAQTVAFEVYLQPRDAAGAAATAQAVSDPKSSSYRHYLSPAQVKAAYAPADSTVAAVRSWLSAQGLKPGAVPSNNAYVSVTGTVAQIDKAFSVQVGQYKVNGTVLRSTDSALTLPAGIAGSVLGVGGISQSAKQATPDHTTGNAAHDKAMNTTRTSGADVVDPPAGFRNAQPCGDYYGQKVDTTDPKYDGQALPYAPCGYKPAQLRSADGTAAAVNAGIDGRGTTVAIVDAFGAPTLYADAAEYAKQNDPGHPLTTSQYKQQVATPTPGLEDPDQCDAAGWYGEQTLDVEAVHAMAPGANILYVGAADCQDTSLDDALNSVVAAHSADIITNSYGDEGEDGVDDLQEFNSIAVQAALEGIGVYFSSGDSGDEAAAVGHPEADFSATDPWVTAVGGTSLGIDAHGKKTVETGWETGLATLNDDGSQWVDQGYDYGSGGGTSVLFSEPFYQKGVVPTALAKENHTGAATGRVVPDVSDLGDPNTGFLVGETQTFPDGVYYDVYRIGGTSLASPLFAGTMAVADQLDHFHHGFSNPLFYAFSSRVGAFKDVTTTNAAGVVRNDYANEVDGSGGYTRSVRTFDDKSLSIHTAKGYDNTTGLGTPNGLLFLGLS